MDNSTGAEVREVLLKVLTGDDVSGTVLHALHGLGLIHKRANVKKKINKDVWYSNPSSNYELTAKGLSRLQGE